MLKKANEVTVSGRIWQKYPKDFPAGMKKDFQFGRAKNPKVIELDSFKMFQGIFASVAIAFLAFCFTPDGGDCIGWGVGAFFASVARSYISLNGVPGAGIRTLTDMINGLAMVTIFLTLLGSILSNYLERYEVNRHLVGRMDKVSLFVCMIGYCVINIVIAGTASLS